MENRICILLLGLLLIPHTNKAMKIGPGFHNPSPIYQQPLNITVSNPDTNILGALQSMGSSAIETGGEVAEFAGRLATFTLGKALNDDKLLRAAGYMSENEAIAIGLMLIPAIYGSKRLYNYATDYLDDAQKAEIMAIETEKILDYIEILKNEVLKIQHDQNLDIYDRNAIVTIKQQAETLRNKIKQSRLLVSDKMEKLNTVQAIIDALEIEQDRASYTLDPRYIGRQIKRAPGRLYNSMFGRTDQETAPTNQYMPQN